MPGSATSRRSTSEPTRLPEPVEHAEAPGASGSFLAGMSRSLFRTMNFSQQSSVLSPGSQPNVFEQEAAMSPARGSTTTTAPTPGSSGSYVMQGMSELVAGTAGYLRANIVGEPPADYEYRTAGRERFDRRLRTGTGPATLQRQLRNQNYVQDRMGNPLPDAAANAMLSGLEEIEEATQRGDTEATRQAHTRYMLNSIAPFEAAGSSFGPRVLHHIGAAWQAPGIHASPGHLSRPPRSMLERFTSFFS